MWFMQVYILIFNYNSDSGATGSPFSRYLPAKRENQALKIAEPNVACCWNPKKLLKSLELF